jgi:hypothetical protein
MYENIDFGFSPLTGKVYMGKSKKGKINEWVGEKKNVTSEVLDMALQVLIHLNDSITFELTDGRKFILKHEEIK